MPPFIRFGNHRYFIETKNLRKSGDIVTSFLFVRLFITEARRLKAQKIGNEKDRNYQSGT